MKLPPLDESAFPTAPIRPDTASAAVRAARLIGFLKGKGLTAGAIEELFRPESASTLRGFLTDRPLRDRVRSISTGRDNGGADEPSGMGKLLLFRTDEDSEP